MAKQTITKILDDLTGDEADETVSFAMDGVMYEIDLSTANAMKLREFMGTYIEAGTRVGRVGQPAQLRTYRGGSTSSVMTTRSNRDQNQAIREWASANNYDLAERGRIPQHIVDAYHQRHATANALAEESAAAAKALPEAEQDKPAAKRPRKQAAPAATFSGSKQKIPA